MIEKTNMASIQSMMAQIRQYEARATGAPEASMPIASGEATAKTSTGFGDLVKGAVDSVNAQQQNAQAMATAFEKGEDVPLTDVVLAMQKSSIAFEATLQIRNKVMRAYEDIKNMPI